MRNEAWCVLVILVALSIPSLAGAQLAWELPAPVYPRSYTSRQVGESTTPHIFTGFVLTPGAT